jgi:hypothetical protein
MNKNLKRIYSRKNLIYFFDQKLQFTSPKASIKDVQATGEAFGPQKSRSSTSKHEISELFSIFVVYFCRIRIPNPYPYTLT